MLTYHLNWGTRRPGADHEKYDKEEVIVKAHVNKIMNRLKLKESDVDGLEEFAIQLSSYCDMLRGGVRWSKEIQLPVMHRDVSNLPYSL